MKKYTAKYNELKKELALTKANIASPEAKTAVKDFSGERYIQNARKSFCMVSREPETGCLQETRIP
ncbi:MAG: hypothetical protein JSS63_08095 [Bacteroidetes bacterium]|nr:hypothetical protein [Bacteroidota bacterium]